VTGSRTIAVNASIIGERPTGLGFYALQLIRALDELGEHLIVHTSRPEAIVARQVTAHRITAAVRPERGAAGHLARFIWTQVELRRRVRRDRPRLLLNLMPEGLLFSSTPQIVVVHDLLPVLYAGEYPRLRYYFHYCLPAILSRSQGIIVISESTRRDVLRFYPRVAPENVHVVLPGYDAERFFPTGPGSLDADPPYAFYAGNVMPHKNLLRLVEAFAAVARVRSGRLVIRGWGRQAHVRALRDRIVALGVASRVDWQPYAPDAELVTLYRGARMLVLPSLYEGFGLTALEAMACGTPVVASLASAVQEVVGDAAVLVDPLDVSDIAEAMLRVFGDDALAARLRQRGRARAAFFSWEKAARAVQDVIEAVLNRPA
jgi:glycosyltransferase involved in cell wall biosynthesis